MGRRHLIPLAALAAATLLSVPAAVAGTRASTWLLQGKTVPVGARTPSVHIAASRADLGPWLRRLTPAHQARVRAVDLDRTVLVAGFLDGAPCASDVRLRHWSLSGTKLIVELTYRKPRLGVATCVRTSISYVLIGFSRAALARRPSAVELRTFARS